MRNRLLGDADWAGMGIRSKSVPLVDLPLLREALVVAHSEMKKADCMSGILCGSVGVKALTRPKTGCSVPITEWLLRANGERTGRGLRGWASLIAGRFGFAINPSLD